MAGELVKIFGLFICCKEPLVRDIFGKGSRIIKLGYSLAISKLRESVGRTMIVIKKRVSWIVPESLGASLISILWVLNSLDTFSGVRRALLKIILRFCVSKILTTKFSLTKNMVFLGSLRLFKHIKSVPSGNTLD